MRIAIVGNQDNNGYKLCKWLREAGHEADLFTFQRDKSMRSQPRSVDREINATGLPSWIRPFEGMPTIRVDEFAGFLRKPRRLIIGSKELFGVLRRPKSAVMIEANYDVALTAGVAGIVAGAYLGGIPSVHLGLGSELSILPFKLFRRGVKWNNHGGRIGSWLARRSLRRSNVIIANYRPEIEAVQRLGHGQKLRILGVPEDVEGNEGRVDRELLRELTSRYERFDRILLWFSRLHFLDPANPKAKGPDEFLKAFRKLIHENGCNVRAVIGSHGQHAEEFQKLVRDWRLEPYVEYVPHLPFWKLLTYLRIPNAIVCDALVPFHGSLSGTPREAICMGAVVLKTFDHELVHAGYGEDCPIIHVADANSCYRELLRLVCLSKTEFRALQDSSLAWARRHLDVPAMLPRFIKLFREVSYLGEFQRFSRRSCRAHTVPTFEKRVEMRGTEARKVA